MTDTRRRRPFLRIGLTGGIGSGKSAVADHLQAEGAVIIDSDVLAREVVEPGTAGWAAIRERFGPGVLLEDGSLDRAALGAIVFGDERARVDLNAIVHPLVRARAAELEAAAVAADPCAVVVHVVPLLVETGQAGRFDHVIVVDCPVETQVARVVARSGLTPAEAEARVAAQASREERLAAADVVIVNDGSLEDLRREVRRAWSLLVGE